MSAVDRIRGFLLQKPKPAIVRVTGDGESQDIKPAKSYRACAETIHALDPELVECFDGASNLLRAMRLNELDGSDEPQRSAAAPPIPPGLAADPNALMLTHFANLLHRAYEHSTELAFVKMVECFDKINDRSQGIEERLERAEATNRRIVNEQVEDAFERAEEVAERAGAQGGGGELVQQLAGAFLSGSLQKKATPPVSPNGKGHS